jgi:uncharacterized membrane protein
VVALGQWFVLFHIISAFALIAGLVGRELARAYARRQENIESFAALIGLSRWFELWLANHGSHAVLIFGLLAAWTRGWPILGILQGSPVNWVLASLLLYLSFIPLVFLVFIPRGKKFRQALAEARSGGIVTPALVAQLDDPVVRAAHLYEAVGVVIIIYLMVMKPF